MPDETINASNNPMVPSTTNISGDQYNVSGNLIVNQITGLIRKSPSFLIARSKEYYSLFVLKKNTLIASEFSLDCKICLSMCCCNESSSWINLDESSIATLLTFPCIFAEINESTNNPSINQVAYVGYLESITKQNESIVFKFAVCKEMPQFIIKDNFDAFGINYAPLRSELDKPHWAIKKHNLIQTISDLNL